MGEGDRGKRKESDLRLTVPQHFAGEQEAAWGESRDLSPPPPHPQPQPRDRAGIEIPAGSDSRPAGRPLADS